MLSLWATIVKNRCRNKVVEFINLFVQASTGIDIKKYHSYSINTVMLTNIHPSIIYSNIFSPRSSNLKPASRILHPTPIGRKILWYQYYHHSSDRQTSANYFQQYIPFTITTIGYSSGFFQRIHLTSIFPR